MSALEGTDGFGRRLIGPSPDERARMLEVVGVASLDALVDEAIPASIRLRAPLHLPPAEGEHQFLTRLERLAHRNRQFRSYIGLGYHDTVTPAVIQRMVLENPGWYTPYTPYQAEIAQGRLTSLLNFQTMVVDLTGMDVANASLLDEATAAAEAMTLMRRVYEGRKDRGSAVRCLVSDRCLPQTIAVLQSRAEPLGISLEIGPIDELDPLGAFGLVLQYPDALGELRDLRSLVDRAHEVGALVARKMKVKASSGLSVPSHVKRALPQSRLGRKCSAKRSRTMLFSPSAASTRSASANSSASLTSRSNASFTPSSSQRAWKICSSFLRDSPQKPWPVERTHVSA
jgi:glycine dehydrogenase